MLGFPGLLLVVLVACGIMLNTESAKILAYYPTPAISHQVVFHKLTDALIEHGHKVTVITTDPKYPDGKTPINLTEVDVHDLSYKLWREHVLTTPAGVKDNMCDQMQLVFQVMNYIIEIQLNTEEVKRVIDKTNDYDLIIVEAYSRHLLILSHIFKVPLVQVSSLGSLLNNFHYVGAPMHEFLYPSVFRQKLHNLTMWEKITELFKVYKLQTFYDQLEIEENAMLRRVFGNDIPETNELVKNIDLLFLNIHPLWEGVRPVPPNVIYIYGIHQKHQEVLPNELENFLNSSKNGVIYISFGTNVKPSLLPPEKIRILVQTLSRLPYNVIWKWDQDKLPGKSDNIKLSKWLPQSDLLRHPKIKLFITQGGLQSTDEAINAGVPLLGIPMLGDQWFNVEQYLYHKIGSKIDIETMTEESLRAAVMNVIEDKSYRRNIVQLRSKLYDQPEPALERAIWWIEYVLRHGGAKHLRSPAANMPWTEYYEIRLVFTILFALIAVVTILVFILFHSYRKIYRLLKKQTKLKIK